VWGKHTEVILKMLKLWSSQRVREDVNSVVIATDSDHREFVGVNQFPRRVEFDAEMSNFGVSALVLSQASCTIAIAVKRGWVNTEKVETVKELA
jgi:hypothetical protein